MLSPLKNTFLKHGCLNFRRTLLPALLIFGCASLLGCGQCSVTTTGASATIAAETAAPKVSVIEVVRTENADKDVAALIETAQQYAMDATLVYQWKNHVVWMADTRQAEIIKKQIQGRFKGMDVLVYQQPFYEFNRRQCNETQTVEAWDHILLSANLVADTVKQQEYLQYHAVQKKEWPEVAQGFCNAGFQQLLLFKNGRQLMLIISIPKGSSLDELNPRTTENNPRVNDWNQLMQQYQEGIPGTQKDEVWVFFKPVEQSSQNYNHLLK